ncbi:MAG: CapA family protein [Brevibacillus sp.]|nr:CapA family protein [Brevibacillus sp.]
MSVTPLVKQLQSVRIEKGYNFAQIEQSTGIPARKMYLVEQGRAHLTLEELDKLLTLYEITLADLSSYHHRRRPLRTFSVWLAVLLLAVLAAAGIWASSGSDGRQAGILPTQTGQDSAQHGHLSDPFNSKQPNPARQSGSPSITAEENRPVPAGQAGRAFGQDHSDSPAPAVPETASFEVTVTEEPAVTTLRFWGNVLYQTELLPLPEALQDKGNPLYQVVPLERVAHAPDLPAWLRARKQTEWVLNLGTTDVWTESTLAERSRLMQEGYQIVGLDTLPQVYQPLLIETGPTRIGFLSLTRIIHKAADQATNKRIGLASAYSTAQVVKAVQEAKKQVDFLIVLMDWGRTWGDKPESYQRPLAEAIVKAGGDLIVGNHPFSSQSMEFISDKPVYYSLGHSVSPIKNHEALNYILEVDLAGTELQEMRVLVGKMSKGQLSFQLSEEERQRAQKEVSGRFPSSPLLQVFY